MQAIYEETIPEREAYHHLFETTGWNESYQAGVDQLHRAIANSWYTVSAYVDDRLVGFGRVISDGVLYAFICDMIVQPSHQRQGIGSAILQKLVERCRAAGVRVIWLFAAQGKSEFYERHGFQARPAGAPGMQLVTAEEERQDA